MRHFILFCTMLFFPMINFAFFCPTNFNQIDIGITQQKVDELCGKPANVVDTQKPVEDKAPQEWTYFVKQNPLLGSEIPGNIKATIAFDKDGKVINMTINGLSVSTANFCGGTQVQINSLRDNVKKSCGTPAYISRGEDAGPPPAPIKQTEYQYTTTTPAVTLVFENGILVERR